MSSPAAARDAAHERRALILTAAFFLTGFTALAAEVVLNRLLRYVFGAGHEATATVLAAYMSGLAAGAWLFGRLSVRMPRKLAAYGFLELAVALCYAVTPALYGLFKQAGLEAGRALVDSPSALLAARFFLSFLFVFLPTLFMGGTLPVLLGALRKGDALATELPRLYAANTLGAAAGTLISAYLLMPALGLDGTLALCAIFNAAVGALALRLSSRIDATDTPAESTSGGSQLPAASMGGPGPGLPGKALLPLAFAQGALVFALEVVWTHLVGTVIGVTVYAFATMLAAILLGIGLGAALLPRLQRRLAWSHAALFVALEAAAGLAIASTLPLWDRFPDLVALLVAWRQDWSFAERELVRLLFATIVMLPVTALTGAALPALVAGGEARVTQASRLVGRIFAANTLGAIAGSLLTGFVLLGRVGSETLLKLGSLAALALALSALLALRGPRKATARAVAGMGGFALVVLLLAPAWDSLRLTAGSHYYFAPLLAARPEITYFREDAQVGFVSVERQPTGEQVLKTNGKYEGNDAPVEFQDFLGLVGGLYVRNFGSAFLLGVGPGRALATLHELPFARIDAAEHSPAVVAAARDRFAGFVAKPLADPRVRLRVDDGRSALELRADRYDLIVAAISGAAFAGAGSLYNRDFFEVAATRLEEGGVLLLWLQLHHVPELAVRSVLHTLRQVFPELQVYVLPDGGQAFLVASREPLRVRREAVRTLDRGARARQALGAWQLYSSEGLVVWSTLVSRTELARYLAGGPHGLYTDFNPGFEYVAPYGLALPIAGHPLGRASEGQLPAFEPPLSAGERTGLLGLRLQAARDYGAALLALRAAEELLGPSRFSPYRIGLERAIESGALPAQGARLRP